MSLQADVDNVMAFGGGGASEYSQGNRGQRKVGMMSSYIRKQQHAIRSLKGSAAPKAPIGGLVFNAGARLKKQGIVEMNDNESHN